MKLQHSIEIARPASDVFAYVADHDKMSEWISTLDSSTPSTPGPTSLNSEFDQEHLERGKRIRFSGRVTDFEPASQLTLKLDNDEATVTLTYRLTAQGEGTLLEQTTEVKLHSMMLRMVAGAFEGTVRERMTSDFETLRTKLEAGT